MIDPCIFYTTLNLVRVSGVCKLWNRIANDNFFWKLHYQRRFRLTKLEDLLPDGVDQSIKTAFIQKHTKKQNNVNWRKVFDNKWQKERSLRSKVSSDGWKFRTCDLLCCLTVLPNKARKEKHYQVHLKNVMKEVDGLTRAAKKREVQQLSKKRKSQALDKRENNNSLVKKNVKEKEKKLRA